MPVTINGIVSVEQMILNVDTTAKKRVRATLVERGIALRDLARRMAPVDTGDLEKAIQLRGENGGRDASGRFARVEVEVFIDMDMPVPERPGKRMGDYAYEIHEHLTPAGSMRLGEKSQEKQAANPDVMVGGHFFDRAAEQIDKSVDKALLDIFRDL